MLTEQAYMKAKIAESNGNKHKVFDWDKAVRVIKENGYKNCGAGLGQDFEWTAGMILVDGVPYLEDYTYLSSNWATPQLIVYSSKDDGLFSYEEVIDCYIMSDETTYGASTQFPEHLIKLFENGEIYG